MKRYQVLLLIISIGIILSLLLTFIQQTFFNSFTFLGNNTSLIIQCITSSMLIVGMYWIIKKYYQKSINKELDNILHTKANSGNNINLGSSSLIENKTKKKIATQLTSIHATLDVIDNIKRDNLETARQATSTIQMENLQSSLHAMIDNMEEMKKKEELSSWFNQGIAKFSDIFSQTNQTIDEFGIAAITTLAKYTHCTQGALFLKSEYENNEYLQLTSCYAYDREKFKDIKIEKGESLVGQCWQEGQVILIKDVPKDYVKISSGLGTALPKNILLVPLVYHNIVEGVIELSSFGDIGENEKNFVVKVGELIASQVQSRSSNDKIKNLLMQSEEKTQQLLSQEEELRQNTEEITAQREDLERKVAIQKKSIEKLQNSEDSVVINVAGRQRMLSQQMAFYSTMLYHGKMEVKEDLNSAMTLFDHSLETLEKGGVFKGVGYDEKIGAAKGNIAIKIVEVKSIWEPIQECIKILLQTDYSLAQIATAKEETFRQIRYVEDNINHLLRINHELTQAYMNESFRWRKEVFDDMESLFADSLVGRFN